jgi:serine/threonine protein kinase
MSESFLPQGYYIERELGKGSTGTAYLVTYEGRHVVFKVVDMKTPKLKKAVWKEIAIMKYLSSIPNCSEQVICYHNHFETNKSMVIIMEYFEGLSLSQVVVVSPLRVIKNIAKAIQYIHHAGIAHRDIKPGNILVSRDDRIKIIDFDLACAMIEIPGLEEYLCSDMNRYVGTPKYYAPELWAKNAQEDEELSSDIYSLGVTFFIVANGEHPFPKADSKEELKKMVLTTSPAPSKSGNVILDILIGRMMNRIPVNRPTIDEAVRTLDTI